MSNKIDDSSIINVTIRILILLLIIGGIGGFIFSGFIGLFTGAIVISLGYKLFVTWINTTETQA
jgi:hypothetical protein